MGSFVRLSKPDFANPEDCQNDDKKHRQFGEMRMSNRGGKQGGAQAGFSEYGIAGCPQEEGGYSDEESHAHAPQVTYKTF